MTYSYPPGTRIRSRWPQDTYSHADWAVTEGPVNIPARLGLTPGENRDRVTGERDRGGDANPATLATLQNSTLDPPGSIGSGPPVTTAPPGAAPDDCCG